MRTCDLTGGSRYPRRVTIPTRPVRQEQEPAREDVTEVAPGMLRLQLPISLPGLGHVNCYALEDAHGLALVDPGLPGPQSWRALQARLTAAGFPVRRVHTVVVTHSHPDHFGGANRLRRESGAAIVTSALFRNWWDAGSDAELDSADDPGTPVSVDDAPGSSSARSGAGGTTPWGGRRHRPPARRRVQMRVMRSFASNMFTVPDPTQRLDDAETIRLAGREWIAVHTPGHTPDHLCLLDPAEGVLLSGDHVLPTITPHISGVGAGADPLQRFFSSLERMHALAGVRTVLPAHGHPFEDLHARADAIRDHHLERLTTLRRAMDALGPATVADLSHELFKPRSWGSMAESETYAHLEHLRLAGESTRDEAEGVLRYRTA